MGEDGFTERRLVIQPALRYASCPTCGRVFEPSVLYCPVCEGPTRLQGYFPACTLPRREPSPP